MIDFLTQFYPLLDGEPGADGSGDGGNPDGQGSKPDAGNTNAPTGKTYTEEELNAIVTSRLSKNEKSLRKDWEKEQAELKRQAELTAEERAKELKQQLEAKDAEIESAKREASDRVALAGKVHDLDYAMYKLGNGDDYRTKDGALDVDAFLKANPTLKAQPDPKPGPAPTTSGGSTQFKTADMNALIRQKAGRS